MNRKKIDEIIDNIADDIIEEAEKERFAAMTKDNNRNTGFKVKKVLASVVATAAVIAIAIAGVIVFSKNEIRIGIKDPNGDKTPVVSTDNPDKNKPEIDTEYDTSFNKENTSLVAKLSHYPESAPYPDESAFWKDDGSWDMVEFDKQYSAWMRSVKSRNDSVNKLGASPLDFYKRSAKCLLADGEGKNKVYSPVNIYIALSMLCEITDGESREELLNILGYDSIEALRSEAGEMWLANYINDGATTSILANSLWLNRDHPFNDDTLELLADKYYASSYSGDVSSPEMTAALREWLNEQTGGLLKDYVDSVELKPETVVALCSTVYFKAMWYNTFDPAYNDQKVFHGYSADSEKEFMNGCDLWGNIYYGDGYSAITLGFADTGNMWFFLPDEGRTPNDILNSGEFINMISKKGGCKDIVPCILDYSIPKFDVSYDINLKEKLLELGVNNVFDSQKADFTPLSPNSEGLYVSDAKHCARVTIDEEGCTAAAFTVITVDGAGMADDERRSFIVDRPFVFAIDNGSSQPLFIGTVYEP